MDVWLDNDYIKRTNIKLHQYCQQTVVRIIATQVIAGSHTLTIDVVKQGNSALVGVVIRLVLLTGHGKYMYDDRKM